MLKDRIRRKYARLRALGYRAHAAMEAARIEVSWQRREAGEHDAPDAIHCVRVRMVPDQDADLSYLEQDEFADARASEYERANRDGVWGVITEYFDEASREWVQADSCWGFVGDDWNGSGYDIDMKRAALAARTKSLLVWRSMCHNAP